MWFGSSKDGVPKNASFILELNALSSCFFFFCGTPFMKQPRVVSFRLRTKPFTAHFFAICESFIGKEPNRAGITTRLGACTSWYSLNMCLAHFGVVGSQCHHDV